NHSLVNSRTLPMRSWAPQALTQAVPPPVLRATPAVTQLPPVPSEAPGSTVPRPAANHSSCRGNRLPAIRQASLARNQEMKRVGMTPLLLSAYRGAVHL